MKDEIRTKRQYNYTCDYCGKKISDPRKMKTVKQGLYSEYNIHSECYNEVPKILRDNIDTIVEAVDTSTITLKWALTLDSVYYVLWEDPENDEPEIGKYNDDKIIKEAILSIDETFPEKSVILVVKNGNRINCKISKTVELGD